MAKLEGSKDLAGFLAIENQLTAAVAAAFEERLTKMGADVKGVSWFSSVAHDYAAKREPLAA